MDSKDQYTQNLSQTLVNDTWTKKKQKWYRLPFTTEEFTRTFTYEFMGTFFLAYGALACEGSPVKLAVFFFLAIVLAGPFSGAHINPAVSLAFYLKAKEGINKDQLKVYWFAQITGAFVGGFFGYLILGNIDSPFVPRQEVRWMLADFLGEILGTFFFIIFIQIQCGSRTKVAQEPLMGFVLITIALMGGRQYTFHSGGCLNPGLALGLNIFKGITMPEFERFQNLWIVVLGPLAGGALSTYFYDMIYIPYLDSMVETQTSSLTEFNNFTRTFIFEFISTSLLAYGALACQGDGIKLGIFFFLAIILAAPFTGSHINPAVTFALYCKKKSTLTIKQAIIYVFGQLCGAYFGGVMGYHILGEVGSPFIPHESNSWLASDFLGEILGTFYFILYIQIQCGEKTAIAKEPLLKFAFIAISLMGGRQYTNHSGGCLNPALAIGLNIFVGVTTFQWERLDTLYIVTIGPLIGGFLSTKFYENIYKPYIVKEGSV